MRFMVSHKNSLQSHVVHILKTVQADKQNKKITLDEYDLTHLRNR